MQKHDPIEQIWELSSLALTALRAMLIEFPGLTSWSKLMDILE
jgi:hypothetical protein